MIFHPEILSGTQQKVLHRVGPLATGQKFYMGGGTALAIHLGHRRSQDFGWFTLSKIDDSIRLAGIIQQNRIPFSTDQVDRGTLHGRVFGVRMRFLEYHYPLLKPRVRWPQFNCWLASLPDLACMKLSSVAQQGSKKDFIDIYVLGTKVFSLGQMIAFYRKKFSIRDKGHLLYGLTYFDEADRERMPAVVWDLNWKTIKKTIQQWVKNHVVK